MSNFLEKTLEDIVMSNLDKMPSKGLDIFYKNTVNQMAFKAGIVDIFTWEEVDNVLYCRIIELKKDCIDEGAFWQVFNYKVDLFLFICKDYGYIKDIKIDIVLIGSSFKENVELISYYAGLKLYKYVYDIDGIVFEEKESWINDSIIGEIYKEKLSEMIGVSKKESFTDNVIKLARGNREFVKLSA